MFKSRLFDLMGTDGAFEFGVKLILLGIEQVIQAQTIPANSLSTYDHHVIEYLFRVDKWTGTLEKETDESVDAAFHPLENLPEASNEFFAKHHERVFEDFKRFNGTLVLK